jgi:DNA-binding response OmpR family regulator
MNETSPKQLNILVVEDEIEVQRLIAMRLEQRGHGVTVASTGRQAIPAFDAAAFDVVVCDVLLPDGDGLDVMAHVRRRSNPPRLVAISGGGRFASADYCRTIAMETGADLALLKPFKTGELVAAVEG